MSIRFNEAADFAAEQHFKVSAAVDILPHASMRLRISPQSNLIDALLGGTPAMRLQ